MILSLINLIYLTFISLAYTKGFASPGMGAPGMGGMGGTGGFGVPGGGWKPPSIEEVCREGQYVYSQTCGFGITQNREAAPSFARWEPWDSIRRDAEYGPGITRLENSCYVLYPDATANRGCRGSRQWELARFITTSNCSKKDELCHYTYENPSIHIQDGNQCLQDIVCKPYERENRLHLNMYCPPIEFTTGPFMSETFTHFTIMHDMSLGFQPDESMVEMSLMLKNEDPPRRSGRVQPPSYRTQDIDLEFFKNLLKHNEARSGNVRRAILSHKLKKGVFNNDTSLVGAKCDPSKPVPPVFYLHEDALPPYSPGGPIPKGKNGSR